MIIYWNEEKNNYDVINKAKASSLLKPTQIIAAQDLILEDKCEDFKGPNYYVDTNKDEITRIYEESYKLKSSILHHKIKEALTNHIVQLKI